MNFSDIKGDHFYGIIPNGKGYMVDWCSKMPGGGICRVPASGNRDRNIWLGVDEPFEDAARKAKILSCGEEIVVFHRLSDETSKEEDRYTFVLERRL